MFNECNAEAGVAVAHEGEDAIDGAFDAIGEMAADDLVKSPSFLQEFKRFGQSLDQSAWTRARAAAGGPTK